MQISIALATGGVRTFNTDADKEGKLIIEHDSLPHGIRLTFPGGNTVMYPWPAVLYVQHTFEPLPT